MTTQLQGQVAFITGGASGIGLALAHALGARGMQVMIADIDESGMTGATGALAAQGIAADSVHCDVSDPASIAAAREATLRRFNAIHWLVNNAGVFSAGGAGDCSADQWQWAMNVNLMGVIRGVETFLPDLERHPQQACILNTASVAGHVAYANVLPYCTTKFAVVGYTESLHRQLAPRGMRVSVLCPGFVNTRIAETERYPQGCGAVSAPLADAVATGMSPDIVAECAVGEVLQGQLYVFTHPGTRDEVLGRFREIEAAFDRTQANPTIRSDADAQRPASREGTERLHR